MTDRYERIRAALADMDAAAEARNALAWRDAHARFVMHVAPDTIHALLEERDAQQVEIERLHGQLRLALRERLGPWGGCGEDVGHEATPPAGDGARVTEDMLTDALEIAGIVYRTSFGRVLSGYREEIDLRDYLKTAAASLTQALAARKDASHG